MKKIIFLMILFVGVGISTHASDDIDKALTPIEENEVQTRIENVGVKILNSNKIDTHMVFLYSDLKKEELLNIDKTLHSGQVIVYKDIYKFIEDDNELAAGISRGILYSLKSLKGIFGGTLPALQMRAAPKKFELVADKCGVDFMVQAGYNPLAMITFINKTVPQKRHDLVSNKNLASKRMAIIYEYIYTKYPYYLKNNEYIDNIHYQNFLLTSQANRKLLEEKIKNNSNERLHYE